MRRFVLIGFLLLLAATTLSMVGGVVFPASAGAAKCITCEGEEPGEEAEAQTLTIEIVGHGSVGNGTKTYCENASAASKTCDVEFAEGKKATLSATPIGEYVFQGWSGSGCSGTGSCEVTMTEAKSVQATFTNPPPALPTISSPSSGQVFERSSEEPVSVSFTDGDPTIVEFRCHIDSLPEVSCVPPSWTTPKLGAGEHTVYVSARDGGGNVSTVFRSFKVVITPPSGEEPKDEPKPGAGGSTPSPVPTLTSNPPTVAPAVKIDAKPVVKTRLLGKSTVFRKLALKALPTGAKVAATCKGKGCPFKRKQIAVANGIANLTALFAKHALAAGALIELKVSAPGMTGQTVDVKTRAGKAPKVTTS